MPRAVVRNGDTAVGHTDILGSPITGTVQIVGSHKTTVGGVGVGRTGDVVNFPSHAHALYKGTPIDYRSHQITIQGSSNSKSDSAKISLNGDVVAVADEAGGNATLVASQDKTVSRS